MDMCSGHIIGIPAKTIIIATGGYGRAYWVRTSNPASSTGDGIVVGIPFKDPEMVQFHPTGLAVNGVLLSESSRSESALLLNKDGERFMQKYALEKMELATRDIVAHAELIVTPCPLCARFVGCSLTCMSWKAARPCSRRHISLSCTCSSSSVWLWA